MSLVLTLSVLIALTAPMLALLSASTFEPLIARNLVDATQALYVAEAGTEWAFTLLVNTPDWATVVRPSGEGVRPEDGQPPATVAEPGATEIRAPEGLLPWGTATITVRPAHPAGEPSSPDGDTAGMVIVSSTGTVNGAQRTVEVVVTRLSERLAQGSFDLHTVGNWRER